MTTEVKVYYMYHRDALSGLTSLLLLDGERVWHVGKKGNSKMYYLFLTEKTYIKIWRDKKGNLLMYLGDITKPLFTEEIDVVEIDITLTYVDFVDDAMYIGNNYFKFSMPIIGIVRRLNEKATRPLAFLLYRLLMEQPSHDTPAEPLPEAQEVQQEEVEDQKEVE